MLLLNPFLFCFYFLIDILRVHSLHVALSNNKNQLINIYHYLYTDPKALVKKEGALDPLKKPSTNLLVRCALDPLRNPVPIYWFAGA